MKADERVWEVNGHRIGVNGRKTVTEANGKVAVKGSANLLLDGRAIFAVDDLGWWERVATGWHKDDFNAQCRAQNIHDVDNRVCLMFPFKNIGAVVLAWPHGSAGRLEFMVFDLLRDGMAVMPSKGAWDERVAPVEAAYMAKMDEAEKEWEKAMEESL